MTQVSSKKPSKRIWALIIIAVTCIFCAVIFKNGSPFRSDNSSEPIIDPEDMVQGSTRTINEVQDTDSDGLMDWEETLRGTDTRKADSDSDGTSDGDEVKQNRNPLVAGPNDESTEPVDSSIVDASNGGETEVAIDNSVTAELGKNLLTQLLYLKNNESLTLEAKEKMLADLTVFAAGSFKYKVYKKETMLFIDNMSLDQLKVYASDFATIQINLIANISRYGDAIVEDINVLSDIYTQTAKQLSEIAIPRELADIHTNIVNNYSIVAKATESFKEDSDSATKTFAIGAYQQAQANQMQSLQIIANYLRQNGILFTSDEMGIYWSNF